MSTSYLLIVAAFAALLAAGLFFVFVRPVASRVANGVIVEKTFEDERSIQRLNAGPRRELWTANRIRIPAGFIFTIRLGDGSGDVYYMLERVAAEQFHIGQSVTVTYDERGIPAIWSKRYVRVMTAAPSVPVKSDFD